MNSLTIQRSSDSTTKAGGRFGLRRLIESNSANPMKVKNSPILILPTKISSFCTSDSHYRLDRILCVQEFDYHRRGTHHVHTQLN